MVECRRERSIFGRLSLWDSNIVSTGIALCGVGVPAMHVADCTSMEYVPNMQQDSISEL